MKSFSSSNSQLFGSSFLDNYSLFLDPYEKSCHPLIWYEYIDFNEFDRGSKCASMCVSVSRNTRIKLSILEDNQDPLVRHNCSAFVTCYIDGVIVFSKSWEEHLGHLDCVLPSVWKG